MRRTLVGVALALVAAAAFAGSAAAKGVGVELAEGPPSLERGEPWNATLLVYGVPPHPKGAGPAVEISNEAGKRRTFPARATGEHARDGRLVYRARVVFPGDGLWKYGPVDGVTEREYPGGRITISGDGRAPAAEPGSRRAAVAEPGGRQAAMAAPGESGSFPAWSLLAGGGTILLVALAGAALVRRSRLERTA